MLAVSPSSTLISPPLFHLSMKGARTAVLFVLLLLFSSLSLAVLSVNKGDLKTALNNEESPMEVIVPLGQANVAGFQEGSIYTNTTLSSSLEMDSHTCAILDNGDLKCWGSDVKGQLGDGGSNTNTNAPSSTAIDLGTGRTAVAVSAGDRYTCAILDNGDLKCWGWDYYGQLGDGGTNTDTNAPSSTAIDLGTGRTAVAVSAGSYHTCVILDNGDLKCWGRDNHGQLGDGGSNTDTNTPSSTAIDLGTGRTAVAVDAGDYHTCAILDNGDMKCWGYDFKGQLGDGGSNTNTNAPSSTAIDLGTGRTAVAVSAGAYHTCAILDNGDLKCWGWDDYGQLGDGGTNTATNAPSSTAIDLGTGRTAVAMSTGETHTCAILDNGEAKCWGRDLFGQLGDGGSNTATNAPSSTAIDLGTGRTMAVSERDLDGDGVLNIFDSTPYTPTTNPSNPLPQRNVPGFQEGSIFTNQTLASGGSHTCAILDNGSVSCWGLGTTGQIGDETFTSRNISTPTSSLGAERFAVSTSSGGDFTCVILDDGSVSCWGFNGNGRLGDGTTVDRNTPTQTLSLGIGRTAVAISAGGGHACAILDNGSVSCWGWNYNGGLGDGTTVDRNTPTQTLNLGIGRTAVAISAGAQHSCALLDNGSVSCWGYANLGALGNGSVPGGEQHTPTLTSTLGVNRSAVAISSGGLHTCAILDNGSISCWGYGSGGRLGNADTSNKFIPTLTSSLGASRTAVALSSGDSHTCAILDDGSVSCWGDGGSGRLGNGGTSNQNSPTLTSSLGTGRTAIALSSGNAYTCAILDNGSVSCWGRGNNGQLGNGWFGTDNNYKETTPTLTSSLGVGRTVAVSERDFDGDGILNIFDSTPYTVLDADGDGIPDFTDDCPDSAGNSTIDLLGCPDSDGDGYSDSGDFFPSNPGEWDDADGDGTGDNGDSFPNDGNETSDSDGDGVGDNADVFPDDSEESVDSDDDGVGDNADVFPNDGNETSDSDGDGVGDNADVFPNNSNETTDSDSDGVGDNADVFPNNSNETADSDNDGLGDNEDEYPFINNFIDSDGDEIPDLFDDFINDPTQWSDYDGDGYGDYSEGNNSDAFINNATQWSDTDGDGYGDNWGNSTWNTTRLFIWPGQFVTGAELADHCPTEFGNSSADGYFGCLDVDGDGIADMYDDLIQNESQSNEANETNETVSIDSDADGVDDLYDLCPSTVADGYVDIDGCLFDQDGDGVDDLKDACPDSNPQVSVNVNGCAVESDEEKSFLDSFRSGDQGAVLQTVGIGAVLIALLGFLQTNLVAALLPDSVRWLRVFKGNSKLNKEEVQELEYLKSLVQTYYQDRELLEDELFQLKSELTARYTNSEIKKTTREKINTIVEDLLNMGDSELTKIAHNDSYFGLYGATGVGQRSDVLELDKLMNSSELTGKPDSLNQGEVNAIDGYESLQYPAESDT